MHVGWRLAGAHPSFRDGVADSLAETLAERLADPITDGLGEVFANGVSEVEPNALGDLLGVESASEGALLHERGADRSAETLRQGIFQPLPHHRPDALPDRLCHAVPNLLGDPLAEQLHHRALVADYLPAEPAAERELSLASARPGTRQTFRHRRANGLPEPLARGVLESLTDDLTQAILHALDEPLLQRLTQPFANRRDDTLRITARLCLRDGGHDGFAQPLAHDLLDDALANHVAEPLAGRLQDALAELGLDPLA